MSGSPEINSWVDNENNNQSQDLNILNNIHGESLIYGVREKSISWGYQKCEQEHSKAIHAWMGNTGMWSWTGTRGKNYTIDRDIRVGTWWHLSSSMELGSGNLGSHGEVVNVMLWGLTSSKVELGVGVMREVWQDLELANISQQCHMIVMGHNNYEGYTI